MLIKAINNSFLLNTSQKIYLIKKIENSNEIYKNKLFENIQNEKQFIISLLKKYKEDSSNQSIGQLKGELIKSNFEKIRKLEESDNDDFFDLEKELLV